MLHQMHQISSSHARFSALRAVRGAVGHGDARGAADGLHSGGFVPGTRVRPVRRSHCVHPPGDGGTVCIPSCPPAALVR